MEAEFQKKIHKLISKIIQNSQIDYGDRNSVRKYNRNQDWIRKNFGDHASLSFEELGELKSLLQHPSSAVRVDVAWSLICWHPLCFDELKKIYRILLACMNDLNQHQKISYSIGIDLWKKRKVLLCNSYTQDLEC